METPTQPRRIARLAGVWYAAFIVLSILGGAFQDTADTTVSRLSLVATVAGYACLLIVAATLFRLFRQVDGLLALLMLAFAATGAAINFPTARGHGELISAVFWWLWLVPLGLLILRSELIPRFFGALLLVGCLFHLMDFGARLFAVGGLPQVEQGPAVALTSVGVVWRGVCYAVEVIAEFSLLAWLLVKGVRVRADRSAS